MLVFALLDRIRPSGDGSHFAELQRQTSAFELTGSLCTATSHLLQVSPSFSLLKNRTKCSAGNQNWDKFTKRRQEGLQLKTLKLVKGNGAELGKLRKTINYIKWIRGLEDGLNTLARQKYY